MSVNIAVDTFTRANQSGWGTASDGNTWTHPAGTATLSILSNTGKLTGATGSNNMLLGTTKGASVNALVRFQMSNPTTDLMGLLIRFGTNNARLELGSGVMRVRIAGSIVATRAYTSPTANTLYWVRMVATGTTYTVRAWQDGTSEPGTWDLTFTDTTLGSGQVGLFSSLAVTTNTIQFDSFSAVVTPTLYYVDPLGSDTNTGLDGANPIQTLARVATLAALGDTFTFANGSYVGQVTLTATGTAANPITLISTNKWCAKLTESATHGIGAIVLTCNGDYTVIDGFEVTGPDVQDGILLQNNTSTVQNCWVHDVCNSFDPGSAGGGGIVDARASGVDGAASNFSGGNNVIHNNRVERVGTMSGGVIIPNDKVHTIYLQNNSGGQVYNNLCIQSSGWGVAMFHNPNNYTVTNNTIINCLTGGANCWGDTGAGFLADHNTLQNNIFVDCGHGSWFPAIWSQSDNCGTHNVFRNNLAWHNSAIAIYDFTLANTNPLQTATNRPNANPQFISYTSDGTGNYHLSASSPAIDTGFSTGVPTTDYDGVSRPQRSGFDIGAYEFLATISVPYATYINNQQVFVEAGSLTIDNTIGKRSQASFTLHTDNITHFQQYQQVSIYDQNSNLAFSGYIDTPKEYKTGFQAALEHEITCIDQHFLADKRVVAASYVNKSPGYIVNDIYTNILASEGVTIGQIYDGAALVDLFPNTTVFPSTTLYPTEAVAIIPQATFVYCTVAQALDELAKAASALGVPYYWMIDQFKKLWFVPYTAVVNTTVIDGTHIDDGTLTGTPPSVTRTNPTYRNTQYLLGGYAQTVTQNETRKGDGNTTSWPMNFDLASAPTITVNAVTKAVGIRGVDSGKDWYWQQGSPDISQDSGGTKLVSTDTLAVTYIGQYPTVVINQNNAQITYEQSLDSSTGIIEEVESDATISSVANGLARTSQLLTRYATQGTLFEGMTLQSGYAPGQLVTFNLPDYSLNNVQMLIEEVSASDQTDQYNIWYTIKAILGPYDTGWSFFFSTLLKQQSPANSINVGLGQSVQLLQSFTGNVSPTATYTATAYACPIPSNSLFPSLTLFPC